MKAQLDLVSSVLEEAGFTWFAVDAETNNCLAFENHASFGFLHIYEEIDGLMSNWKADSENAFSKFRFQIKSSGEKAWNAYSVFLAFEQPNAQHAALLARIEEDLSGTRKIARAVSTTYDKIRLGLLPLLRIQSLPVLEPVDIVAEIRTRAVGLPAKAVEAFLLRAPNSEVLRLMGRSDEA